MGRAVTAREAPITYFMQFDKSMKAIRPSDNTRLRMPTQNGDIEVHV